MSRFLSDKSRLTLPDGSWIEVKKMSFEDFMLNSPLETDDVKTKAAKNVEFLKKSIVAWDFKLDDGTDVECTPNTIEQLDMKSMIEIITEIQALYAPSKKKEMQSGAA